ncbi:DNA repair protein RecN [Eremococcus coleocola]|uniref:DNA repair protein RecN n=1 Tax=Eremococcus coleocola TaxID=88132 RepID=UPI00040B68DC|nr:DNA repair protein RecN [Eremococcus coleocola]
MLISLNIENFAIIQATSIDFSRGMTVLSGETGAGKSIIIDALGLVCGGRGSVDFIRKGADKLSLEALFVFDHLPQAICQVLDKYGLSYSDEDASLLLQRQINLKGANLIRVNGHLANVSMLKELGAILVDIHGQNEHQVLLNPNTHLDLVDQFAGPSLLNQLQTYQKAYANYRQLRKDWISGQETESNQLQRLDFIQFQAQELEKFGLDAAEEDHLKEVSLKMRHQVQVQADIERLNQVLSESDQSVLNQLDQAMTFLEELVKIDDSYQVMIDQLKTSRFELEDIAQQLAFKDLSVIDSDLNLDEVESRLNDYSQLKRKYGMTVPELIDYEAALAEEIFQIQHRDRYLAQLKDKLQAAYTDLYEKAQLLDQNRCHVSKKLKHAIETQLGDLYMADASFAVHFSSVGQDRELSGFDFLALHEGGFANLEFYVATNKGQDLSPLVKVASGGELSRFMLALKRVFASQAMSKVMVFDEIDSGVSGRVAHAIADKIKEISQSHQVLCITHLAQVAAAADQQLFIQKALDADQTATQTKVTTLANPDRVKVIASMMSGESLTAASLDLAQELLKDYQN